MKPKICKFFIGDKVKIIPIEIEEAMILEINIRGENLIFYRVRYIDKCDVQIKEFLEDELKPVRVKK